MVAVSSAVCAGVPDQPPLGCVNTYAAPLVLCAGAPTTTVVPETATLVPSASLLPRSFGVSVAVSVCVAELAQPPDGST